MMRGISPIIMNSMNRTAVACLTTLISLSGFLETSHAQDYFRKMETQEYVAPASSEPLVPTVDLGRPLADTDSFMATDAYGAVSPPLPEEEDRYNMALGPVRFNLAAGIGVEFNDNVSLAPSGEEKRDIIIRPSVIMDATDPYSGRTSMKSAAYSGSGG